MNLVAPTKKAIETALKYFITETVSTKRRLMTSGQLASPTTYLTDVKSTPLIPWQSEIQLTTGLRAPVEALEVYVQGHHDIIEGDILVMAGNEYTVRAVANWPEPNPSYLRLYLQDRKSD